MTDPENPFWEYSLAVYGRESVAGACLALQERHGLDVNLLLFCCWAGSRARALGAADLERLIEAARPWQAGAVAPLRAVRRWLKAHPGPRAERLRQKIKLDELEAEAIEQLILAEALPVPDGAGGPAAIVANMAAYFEALGIDADATDTADLAAVLRGCCPDLAPLEAVRLLTG
ncbi:MAG: TIGR02444 family protein [Kiloniellaceae bacterium]